MATNAGFKYFAKVSWKKGNFVANTGRKAKNQEDIMFFSKGEPRSLKLDTKKNKATAIAKGLDVKGLDSYQLRDLLEKHDLPVSFMKGTAGMLPTEFDFQPRGKSEKIMEAEKPVELFEAILPYITLTGERVLDTFAGSGNVGIAAINSGRDAILIEKDSNTFEKMKQNIEQSLGEKTVLETNYSSRLECQNEKIETKNILKQKKAKVLDDEIDCYSDASNANSYDTRQKRRNLDERLQSIKEQQAVENQLKPIDIDVLKISPWAAGSENRIYVKVNIAGKTQTVFYDVNKNEWFNQRKEKININRTLFENQVKECVGVSDMTQFGLLNKNYVKQKSNHAMEK